jgi:hypothetical protein
MNKSLRFECKPLRKCDDDAIESDFAASAAIVTVG